MASDTAVSESIGPTVLVTGGAGFFGRVLTRRLLDEGLRVRVLDVVAHADLDPRAELHQGDLRDEGAVNAAVAGVGTVFHAGAVINLCSVASKAMRKLVHDVNVGGTRHVVAASATHGVRQVIYTSSNNVVFDREIVDGDETEAYATRHLDLYTETKILAEQLVLAAGKAGDFTSCALRPGGLWGPHVGGYTLDGVLDRVAQGTFLARIGARGRTDYTHVDNLASAHLLAARAAQARPEAVNGHAYFVTDGEPMDPFEWFRPLLEGLDVPFPSRVMPTWLMHGIAYGCEWLTRLGGPRPIITSAEVRKVTIENSFRIDKAREQLGYVPTIQHEKGLRECVPFARAYVARKKDSSS